MRPKYGIGYYKAVNGKRLEVMAYAKCYYMCRYDYRFPFVTDERALTGIIQHNELNLCDTEDKL